MYFKVPKGPNKYGFTMTTKPRQCLTTSLRGTELMLQVK